MLFQTLVLPSLRLIALHCLIFTLFGWGVIPTFGEPEATLGQVKVQAYILTMILFSGGYFLYGAWRFVAFLNRKIEEGEQTTESA